MTSSRFVDLYKTLSVSPTATTDQIKSAFFKLAKSYHPDVSSNGSDAKFKQINHAYRTLTKDRQAYDDEYRSHYRHPRQQYTTKNSFSRAPYSSPSRYSSQSPFGEFYNFANSTTEFQWGQAWDKSSAEQKKHKQKEPRSKTTFAQQPVSDRKRFDDRFFWSDYVGNDYWNDHTTCNNSYEDSDSSDYYSERNRYKQRDGSIIWEDENGDFFEAEVEKRYSKHHQYGEELFDNGYHGGSTYEESEDENEAMHHGTSKYHYNKNDRYRWSNISKTNDEFEFLDLDPSDYYMPPRNSQYKARSRLTRKVLQRIREDPRPSDIPLLRKFGLDPRLFGFKLKKEAIQDENNCRQSENRNDREAEEKSRKSGKKMADICNHNDEGRKLEDNPLNCDTEFINDIENDHKGYNNVSDDDRVHFNIYSANESDKEHDSGSSRHRNCPFQERSIEYDFETGNFRWKKNTKNVQSDIYKDSSTSSKRGSNRNLKEKYFSNKMPTGGPTIQELSDDEKQFHRIPLPESVSVFTLASKKLSSQNDPGQQVQPLMNNNHRSDGNRIEAEFFLSKGQVLKWLKDEGDHQRIYGLFKNGSLVNNYFWSGNDWFAAEHPKA